MWRIMYFTMHFYILGVGEQEEEEEEGTYEIILEQMKCNVWQLQFLW